MQYIFEVGYYYVHNILMDDSMAINMLITFLMNADIVSLF